MTKQRTAEAALLGTTLIWGSTFAVQKLALAEISPLMLVVFRFGAATLIWLAVFGRRIFPIPAAAVIQGSILGLFLFLGFIVQTIGLNYTTASKSAFITSMMVVFVPLLQLVIERRSPSIGNALGIIVVSIGLWMLTSPAGSAFTLGDALTLASAVVFAIYIVYLDVVSHHMPTLQLTFLQTATTAVGSFVGVLVFEEVQITASPRLLTALAYLTICATVLTTFIQTRFQKDTTPTKAAIIFTTEPVIAAALAYFLLGEHLGLIGVFGGALILIGVLVSEVSDGIPILSRTLSIGEEERDVSP